MVAFTHRLRDYNDRHEPGADNVSFYGLGLYSLWESMRAHALS